MNRGIGLRFGFVISLLSACAGGEAGEATERGNGSRPPPPPLFEFMPGPPGRAVGVRAVVEVDGQTLTSEPIELTLLDPDANASFTSMAYGLTEEDETRHPAPDVAAGRVESSLQQCPTRGQRVDQMGTLNGSICYVAHTLSSGTLSADRSLVRMFIFAREGLYTVLGLSRNIYVPPTLVSFGSMNNVGCIGGDQSGSISTAYLESLESIGVSFSLFGSTVGYTAFTSPGRGLARAFQWDTGVSFGVRLLPPLPLNASMSVQMASEGFVGPTFLRPWRPDCADLPVDEEANPLEYAEAGLRGMQTGGESGIEDLLALEFAEGVLPTIAALGGPHAGGPGPNVPAASNADFFGEFLHHSGTGLRPNAPNTSIDGILGDLRARIAAGDGDGMAILAGGNENARELAHAMPSPTGLAVLQAEAAVALEAGDALAELSSPTMQDRARFIAERIERIEVQAGEAVEIVVTAQEVAELVGRPVQDVIGAGILVSTGGGSEPSRFELSGPELVLRFTPSRPNVLVKLDVDLTTASGVFPSDVGEWIVRPALRAVYVQAGPAAHALLSAPPRMQSGAPATLNVHVVDESGRVVKRDFLVRFIDDAGNEIGRTTSERGTALLQYVPVPSTPEIETVEPTTVTYRGVESPGLSIRGRGFSRDAVVQLEDRILSGSDEISVVGPDRILLILPEDLAAESLAVTVINPHQIASRPATLTRANVTAQHR